MITFLLEEGVLTVGTLSGLFTTGLLNSLKRNIIDPGIEKLVPSHKLDKDESFSSLFPIPVGDEPSNKPSATIKWQTFLKDLITWIVLMAILYLFWKKVLHPAKLNKMNNFN